MKKRAKRLAKALRGFVALSIWGVLEGVIGGAVGILVVTLWLEHR